MEYFPNYDANGNITAYTQKEANNGNTQKTSIAARFDYSPFGAIAKQTINNSNVENTEHRFSTKSLHETTGLTYYKLRHYRVKACRWTSRDPISERGGINLYTFVQNWPTNLIDIYGAVSAKATLWWGHSLTRTHNRSGVKDGVRKNADWRIETKLSNTNTTNQNGEYFFEGSQQPTFRFYRRKRTFWTNYGSWYEAGGADRMGGVESLWKPKSVSVVGPKDRVLGPRQTESKEPNRTGKRCVECKIWVADIAIETVHESNRMGNLPDFVGAAAIYVKKDKAEKILSTIAAATGLITEQSWTTAEHIGFSLIICADGKRAVGIYNIPVGLTTRFSGGNSGVRQVRLFSAWAESSPGGSKVFGELHDYRGIRISPNRYAVPPAQKSYHWIAAD